MREMEAQGDAIECSGTHVPDRDRLSLPQPQATAPCGAIAGHQQGLAAVRLVRVGQSPPTVPQLRPLCLPATYRCRHVPAGGPPGSERLGPEVHPQGRTPAVKLGHTARPDTAFDTRERPRYPMNRDSNSQPRLPLGKSSKRRLPADR